MLVERLFRWCGGDECSSKPDVFGPNCDYLLLSLHVGALVRGSRWEFDGSGFVRRNARECYFKNPHAARNLSNSKHQLKCEPESPNLELRKVSELRALGLGLRFFLCFFGFRACKKSRRPNLIYQHPCLFAWVPEPLLS